MTQAVREVSLKPERRRTYSSSPNGEVKAQSTFLKLCIFRSINVLGLISIAHFELFTLRQFQI